MSPRFGTLVFDLDGTLSDPSEGIARSVNYALARHGHCEIPGHKVADLIGPPLNELFEALVPDADDREVDALIESYRQRYSESGFAENTVYPGMRITLSRLVERGWNLGVCTSKRRDFAERILDTFGLRRYFTFVDGGDAGTPKSLQLSRLLENGTIDRDAVMIGDRAVDIVAARTNRLRSIGVLWGFGSRGELASAEPDFLAGKVGDLERIVAHGGRVEPPVVPATRVRGGTT